MRKKHLYIISFITTGKLESSEMNHFFHSLTGQRNHNYFEINKPTKNIHSEVAPPSHRAGMETFFLRE